ncbi:hypothetical protein [Paludibacterium denitrificans]|uniref:Uncharacterized protein n=1 Tax=Paludibacterium denitrificans TaxID=2675226 RepID=A0A844GCS9_9NEIS|nr:hypothetical protein [Paludibacterium denitrificans]MTD33038.1 hypothetical protein [Paludibacterium denitrificans]
MVWQLAQQPSDMAGVARVTGLCRQRAVSGDAPGLSSCCRMARTRAANSGGMAVSGNGRC